MSQVSDEVHPRRTFVRQYSVLLSNRVGALSALVRLLRQASVTIIGMSVQDSRDATIARLVFDHPDRAEDVFMEKGIPYTLCELVIAQFPDCGAGLNKCLMALLEAETNLDFAYALMVQHQGHALLAMHLEDAHFGANVLHQAGIKVCYEEDLLR